MSDVIILLMITTLFGGGLGYCGFHQYGKSGLAGAVGVAMVFCLVLWFFGGMRVRRE